MKKRDYKCKIEVYSLIEYFSYTAITDRSNENNDCKNGIQNVWILIMQATTNYNTFINIIFTFLKIRNNQ